MTARSQWRTGRMWYADPAFYCVASIPAVAIGGVLGLAGVALFGLHWVLALLAMAAALCAVVLCMVIGFYRGATRDE